MTLKNNPTGIQSSEITAHQRNRSKEQPRPISGEFTAQAAWRCQPTLVEMNIASYGCFTIPILTYKLLFFSSARSLYLHSPPLLLSSQMAPGYAVAVMGIDFTLRYFYKVLLDLLPICNQDKGNKIR